MAENTASVQLPFILAALQRMSPGPYQWSIIEDNEKQIDHVIENIKFGKGPIHGLGLPGHPLSEVGDDPLKPNHMITLLWTGNGPKSEDNAKALHEILTRLSMITDTASLVAAETERDELRKQLADLRGDRDTLAGEVKARRLPNGKTDEEHGKRWHTVQSAIEAVNASGALTRAGKDHT